MKANFRVYCDYNGRNYGAHALEFTTPQGRFWFSYKTLVAFDGPNGIVCLKNYWSTTTGKHLNAIQPRKNERVDQETFDRLYTETFGGK